MRLNITRLELKRKKLGLNKKTFAAILEITPGYYSLLLHGRRPPTITIIEKAYFNLNLNFNELFTPERS